jgi:hypothetical protein
VFVPADWGAFEIREVGLLLDETENDGARRYRQQLNVRLWQPGDFKTPDTYLSYRAPSLNTPQQIPVRALVIGVPTVLDFENLALKPFKPLIDLPYTSPLVLLAGVMAVGGGVAFVYSRWQRWNARRPQALISTVPALSPSELALTGLEALKTNIVITPAERYTEAARVLRAYIQAQYEISAATTADLIEALRERLPEKALNDLARLLTEADVVRFAGAQPDEEVSRRVVELARRWILTVERNTEFA